MSANAHAADATAPLMAARTIAVRFLEVYYKTLHDSPESAFQFYNDDSHFSRLETESEEEVVVGPQAINEKLSKIEKGSIFIRLESVAGQYSGESVLVMVTGSMTNRNGAGHNFAQTFLLARKPEDNFRFYVKNDILRLGRPVAPASSPISAPALAASPVPITDIKHLDGPKEAVKSGAVSPRRAPEPVASPRREKVAVPVVDGPQSKPESPQKKDGPTKGPLRKQFQPKAKENSGVAVVVDGKAPAPEVVEDARPASSSWAGLFKGPTVPVPASTAPATKPPPRAKPRVAKGASAAAVDPEAKAQDTATPPVRSKEPANAPRPGRVNIPGFNDADTVRATLYVKNLPDQPREDEIKQVFSQFGTVRHVQIEGGKYCFVLFTTADAVDAALNSPPIYLRDAKLGVDVRRLVRGGSGRGRGRGRGGLNGFSNRGRSN